MILIVKMILWSAYTALLVGGLCECTHAAASIPSLSSSLFQNANENITLPVNLTLSKPFRCVKNSSPAFENRIAWSLTETATAFPGHQSHTPILPAALK